ncbi:MAG: hypothetical protein RIQ62_1585 [Bacteroidota bacterium]|jgi:hypothetical protein
MNSFKDIALQILKEQGKPLHSKDITKIALDRGWLKTAGKTPEATMNAQIIVDINSKKDASKFIKTAPSTFGINPNPTLRVKVAEKVKIADVPALDKKWKISSQISSKQKGDIAEARIAELVTLYGETTLSCYKPISDDEGIDLIVKEKGSLRTMYIQIKSRFGNNPDDIFTATAKASGVVDNYSMAMVFAFFDTEEGDLWDYLWFVPGPDFVKMANRLDGGRLYGFVAGRQRKDTNKWDGYLIDKRDLANAIIAQMKRI